MIGIMLGDRKVVRDELSEIGKGLLKGLYIGVFWRGVGWIIWF